MTEQEQKNIFGINLTRIMEQQDKTQADMVRYFNVSKSTVSSWCNGAKLPRMGKIDAICQWLNIKRSDLLDLQSGKPEKVVSISDATSKRYQELRKIDDALNKAGHTQFVKYGEYLTSQKEYQQAGEEYEPIIEMIRDYLTPPAAGYASPIQGEDYNLIPRDNLVPPSADFCLHVSGDSMEPYIKDGQRIYVKRDSTLEDWDVGVFYYDGSVYVKQLCHSYDGSIYLMSANPKREDANIYISADSSSTLICFGKVILLHKLPMPDYEK